MGRMLRDICGRAGLRVKKGYYDVEFNLDRGTASLKERILSSKRNAIIAEVKKASPSLGAIRKDDEATVAKSMERGGAVAISVITDPDYFGGSLESLIKVRESVKVPVLMKDFVVNPKQIVAAKQAGADAVLLIYDVFKRGYSRFKLDGAIDLAHSLGLEVLLEAYEKECLYEALTTDADLIGINSRNLDSMEVNVKRLIDVISGLKNKDKVFVAESGIETREQVDMLKEYGFDAFLVGTSIMKAKDVEAKVRELVGYG